MAELWKLIRKGKSVDVATMCVENWRKWSSTQNNVAENGDPCCVECGEVVRDSLRTHTVDGSIVPMANQVIHPCKLGKLVPEKSGRVGG
ncbi:hypothetical protein Y032_0526g2952 [Ancylostoma ceylanicum]|uniref:Uncharacterized protein n=1 Tax=Ancylostoma ceylanicum TaxID=53326 RepID=A0A016WTN0_9BILA|nr:hypothetical protein Y032_0526g2952 [Ancylostoma ceylanicum]